MFRRSLLGAGLGVLLFVSTGVAQPGGFPGGGFPGGGPGGPMALPQPGQIMPAVVQEQLKLTAEQKKQVEALQKELDSELAKLLTAEQKKSLEEMRSGLAGGGFGPGGGGRGGFGPGGGGPGGGGPGGFGPGGGGGFGGFGGATVRLDDVKKQLNATDEEWKVINTKIQKVVTARQVLVTEAGGGGGGFGGGFGGGRGTNIVSQAQDDLKTVLNDPKHTKAEVEEKVAAVRKARQKAKADVEAAQKDLLQMLTPAQEAVLVSLGYLE